MKKLIINRYLISALILLFSSGLLASAESDFELGVKSFKAGDNVAAVTYFESAMKLGMNSVALHYNLASSYYKLGRYEDAKKYFKQVNKTEAMRDLAEYNLGLIAIKQKKGNLARQYFNSIKSTGKDKKLIRLSKKQLAALQKKEPPLTAYVSTNLGYDTNISSAASDSVSNISSTFYDLFASANLQIQGKRKDGWIANASLYQVDYSDTDSSDEFRYTFGIKKTFKLSDLETSVKLSLAKTTLNDEDYITTTKLDFNIRKPVSKSGRIYLRYQVDDISSDLPVYDYLEGWRQRARIEYRNYSKTNIKQVYYELELNDRGTLSTSTYAYDYSPTRHTVRGIYTHVFNKQWRLKGDLSYRISDYPESSTINREEDQWKLALSTDYRFDKTFKLTTKLQFTDNSSEEERYDYDKSFIKIGLSKSF